MMKTVRIALDAMGGDFGPEVMLPGAAMALERGLDIAFLLFGDETLIKPYLAVHPALAAVSTLHHTNVAVRMDDKPSQALRSGRRISSMWLSIDAVKKNAADIAVSAGNTGALMAMAKTCLHTMPGVDRPAIAAIWPTIRGRTIVLDVGASIGADARHLVNLAIMGAAMARAVLDVERPTVGLLNIGSEEMKGVDDVKAASKLLREMALPHLDYVGFVEGGDIGRGTVDVVVTEGFSGNIALKTAEGTASQMGQYLREALSRDLMSKIGYFFARKGLAGLKAKMDPRNVNGGTFLGLDGVVIKSHGHSDVFGTSVAIEIAYRIARHELLGQIRGALAHSHETTSRPPDSQIAGGERPAALPKSAQLRMDS
ncbi:phosphate acyltransferase PlsX [Methylocella silvestris]|uniref:Phosphate acyltransferase n=1 Tax=Methylocella silvestris TaxID=199596 RepID=A0A2J7TGU3_METSI|nr:phosphate acyltransferase PlsX [Methylocella silvestris]PNG25992.1 phosphate acyltransferase [Methylocella silvestris]